ncbi:hypothetical protein AQI95_41795 [Streptomyces yokosukanensis]|uniref:Uncharacterized protein n=1 Tax=Streptomyces yokosukanensis TaxID=67386 RepID=A0A124HDE6_9ACTN|nr:hypothetical protein [Streptomyces yokosukanensis]KUM97356.1 hypothetical protein AQI95_41795 [Streptomyces yokosukanensis]
MSYYTRPVQPEPRTPRIHTLLDGTRLSAPQPIPARELRINQWLCLDEEPWQVVDLRARGGGGSRVVHLHGRRPLTMSDHEAVLVYTVSAAPVRRV